MTVHLVLGIALLGGAVALHRLSLHVLRPARRLPERPLADAGIAIDRFDVASQGRRLAAWLLRGRDARPSGPLVVVAHGWGASHGITFRIAEPLASRGFDVVLFDVRGHGGNATEPYVTIRHFRDDVTAVLRDARTRFPGRALVLIGHSMGGAGGVLAAADGAPLDGLVLIAAPADVVEVTADFLTDQGLPGRLLTWLLRPFWWTKVGGSFLPLTPARRIGELRLPILMIQPENDQRVHRGHAVRLAAAAGIELHLIEEREHTDVLEAPRTVDLVGRFVREVSDARISRDRSGRDSPPSGVCRRSG